VVVVEFHPGHAWFLSWADAEGGHATTVDVECAVGEEEKEKSIVGFVRICDVL
jgi:hypothetical protein